MDEDEQTDETPEAEGATAQLEQDLADYAAEDLDEDTQELVHFAQQDGVEDVNAVPLENLSAEMLGRVSDSRFSEYIEYRDSLGQSVDDQLDDEPQPALLPDWSNAELMPDAEFWAEIEKSTGVAYAGRAEDES